MCGFMLSLCSLCVLRASELCIVALSSGSVTSLSLSLSPVEVEENILFWGGYSVLDALDGGLDGAAGIHEGFDMGEVGRLWSSVYRALGSVGQQVNTGASSRLSDRAGGHGTQLRAFTRVRKGD